MIVIIDDQKDVLGIYNELTKFGEIDFKVFSDPLDAMKFFRNTNDKIEAIITDLAMPDIDGLTLAEKIRSSEKNSGTSHIPVKLGFLTAYPKTDAIERIMEKENVDRFWNKPTDPVMLLNDIQQWISEENYVLS